jgi:hypothetical protein
MQVAFYKGTHKGITGIYSIGVRLVTNSPYSHCELILSDGRSASASFLDKGVRYKQIEYTNKDNWDFLTIPDWYEPAAINWFNAHAGQSYDLLGNLHFLIGFIRDDDDDWFCSEALAASLGITNPDKYDPGTLYTTLLFAFPQQDLTQRLE